MEQIKKISDNLSLLLRILHRDIFPMKAALETLGLSKNQFSIIFFLHIYKESAVSEAAKNLEISRPNMTPLIDSLTRQGLIERKNDPGDRRKTLISLTEKGQEIMMKIYQIHLNTASAVLSSLSPDETKRLMKTSEEMLSILKNHTREDSCRID